VKKKKATKKKKETQTYLRKKLTTPTSNWHEQVIGHFCKLKKGVDKKKGPPTESGKSRWEGSRYLNPPQYKLGRGGCKRFFAWIM